MSLVALLGLLGGSIVFFVASLFWRGLGGGDSPLPRAAGLPAPSPDRCPICQQEFPAQRNRPAAKPAAEPR
jgi:hypothetical protein